LRCNGEAITGSILVWSPHPTNSAKDGTFRRIEIRTDQKDFKVQARKGYYAVPSTE